jgi:hypothetical protein
MFAYHDQINIENRKHRWQFEQIIAYFVIILFKLPIVFSIFVQTLSICLLNILDMCLEVLGLAMCLRVGQAHV